MGPENQTKKDKNVTLFDHCFLILDNFDCYLRSFAKCWHCASHHKANYTDRINMKLSSWISRRVRDDRYLSANDNIGPTQRVSIRRSKPYLSRTTFFSITTWSTPNKFSLALDIGNLNRHERMAYSARVPRETWRLINRNDRPCASSRSTRLPDSTGGKFASVPYKPASCTRWQWEDLPVSDATLSCRSIL